MVIFDRIKLTAIVAVHAPNPTHKPSRFMTFCRSIVQASSQYRFRRARKFINRSSVRSIVHAFEDVKYSPSLPLIALRVQDSFSLKIYIIDKCVAPLWSPREALE